MLILIFTKAGTVLIKIRDNKVKRIPHNFTKNCSICNTEFADTTYRKKYSSVKCRNKFKMNTGNMDAGQIKLFGIKDS